MQKQINIKQEDIERTAGTSYYELELSVNNKSVFVSIWFSYDRYLGETDYGFEILGDSDDLTDEEREAVEDFMNERKFKLEKI